MENFNKIIADSPISNFIANNSDWVHQDGKLIANFIFDDFKTAIKIVNEVAVVAEAMNHHPIWSNEYNKLSFELFTHEAENRVTSLDLELAQAISNIVKKLVR